jgi:hypothetical protein
MAGKAPSPGQSTGIGKIPRACGEGRPMGTRQAIG